MKDEWKRFRFVLSWGYAVEIIAAGAIFGVVSVTLSLSGASVSDIVEFMGKTADSWATLTGVLFAGALAFWGSYLNLVAGAFGEFLEFKKITHVYSTALLAAAGIFFVGTVLLIVAKGTDATGIRLAAMYFVIYCLINAVTMVKTASEIVMNHAEFKAQLAIAIQKLEQKSAQAHDQVQSLNPKARPS